MKFRAVVLDAYYFKTIILKFKTFICNSKIMHIFFMCGGNAISGGEIFQILYFLKKMPQNMQK